MAHLHKSKRSSKTLTALRSSIATSALLAGSLILTSCGIDGQDAKVVQSTPSVNNGVDIKESNFPAVVLLVMLSEEGQSICTGTFVSDTKLVTAGHCVDGQPTTNPRMVYAKFVEENGEQVVKMAARASSYVRNPLYNIDERGGVNKNDLAVLTFPSGTAPATVELARSAPSVEDDLTIVGYGNSRTFYNEAGRMTGEGAGSKRFGTNKVALVDDGMISFVGVPSKLEGLTVGEIASSGSGDSGGPMFVGGKLVGVTSGGGLGETEDGTLIKVSHYVDLNSEGSRRFLSHAL